MVMGVQPDSAVWGQPRSIQSAAAASLLNEVAADTKVRLLTAIAGPGGSGKSTLLDDLEMQYQADGVNVRRSLPAIGDETIATPAVVLVDDAHDLGECGIERIHALLNEPGVSVVVSYRPWPQLPALKRLASALEQHHSPVVLGPLSRAEIAGHVSVTLASPVPAILIEKVAALTGGMPWLVYRVTAALRHQDRRSTSGSGIPPGLSTQLGYELSGVDTRLRKLLLAVAVGFDLSAPVPPVPDDGGSVDDVVAQGQAAGLLLPDGTLPEMVRQAVLESTPEYQIRSIQRSLVDMLSAEGHSLKDIARQLGREGLRDARVARSLEAAGDEALPTEPVLASALYDEAASAGADELSTAARRAQAAAAVGELDEACRIVDELFTHEEAPDLRRAVDVAAAAWAQRGMLATSAQMYRWLGRDRAASSAGLAAVAMVGAGDREGAEDMLAAPADVGMPSMSTMGATLMGEGIRDSLEGSPGEALNKLIRASDLMTASAVPTAPLPDSPAVLAAMVALHNGDLDIAGSTLDSAVTGRQGGAAMRPRLLLLKAWAAMRAGRTGLAQAAMAEAEPAGRMLAPRDLLLLHSLKVGIARRVGDSQGMVRAWRQAREDMLHIAVDLYSLLPLGELVIAAARLRDSSRLKPHLDEAWALLNRLGDPPLWTVPLHWSAVQAAILAEHPGELAPHATALVRASSHSHLASVLAAAGKVWVSVLAGKVEPDAVESAARGLAAVGLAWDGSRLAGQAAPRTADRKNMARLLACARELHPAPGSPAPVEQQTEGHQMTDATGSPSVTGSNGAQFNNAPQLSAREREVARLVLQGKTYREIGAAIFISPRTAEHHVARMRRRLGAASRSELLHQLRLALDDDGPGQ